MPDLATSIPKNAANFSLGRLVWRFLSEHRLRALLSGLAVSFGVAIILTADLVGASLLEALLNADIEGAEITHSFVSEQFDMMISIVGYVLIAAAGFVVFNAFTMTISQRQQQIGVLRALGMTRRQMMRLVLAEGLILALLGVAAGLLLGRLMGYGLIALLELFAGHILFFASTPAVSGTAVLQAIILGIGVTLLSIWWPARRASQVPPLVALQSAKLQTGADPGEKSQKWLGWLGVGLLVGTAVFVLLAIPGNWADAPTNTILTVGLIGLWLLGWWLCLPAIIRLAGQMTRRLLNRWGANGRLIGDNVQRETNRVRLTIVTLALGLVMIVGMTGFMTFMMDELFGTSLRRISEGQTWTLFPFRLEGGIAGVMEVESMVIPQADVDQVLATLSDDALVVPIYFAFVPELSFLGDTYFSYLADPNIIRRGPAFFEFSQGSWDEAMPYLQEGCGLLMAPTVARRNSAQLYDTITITTPKGPLDCTIAGIGRSMMNASIINIGALDSFDLQEPVGITITPHDDVDMDVFKDRLANLEEVLPNLWLITMGDYTEVIFQVTDLFAVALNALLLLIVVAAAFGMVNTMIMSVIERQTELGLLRAIGATRRQVKTILIGEAALMGGIGGLLGGLAGLGIVVILILTFGGRSWGIVEMDLWAVVGRTLPSALLNSGVGLLLVPLVAGTAAWLPVNSLLRGSAIETLQNRAAPPSEAARWAFWRRGSIRTRFVVGTAVLLLLTLWGLITFVGVHARQFMDGLAQQTVEMLVRWNVQMTELNLPADAEELSLEALSFAQFDAQTMLQMETLLDGMSDNGLSGFSIMDASQTVLFSRDLRDIGAVRTEIPLPDRLETETSKVENGRLLTTIAPIQNDAGRTLGAMSLTMRLDWIDAFLRNLRQALWLAGGLILLLGVGLSWLIATPLVRATQALSASARATGSGDFQPLPAPKTNWLTRHTSLKMRLTAVLIGLLLLLVGGLQMITIPLEQEHVEETLQETMLTGITWMGQAFTELGVGPDSEMLSGLMNPTAIATLLNASDASKLQEMAALMQNEYTAYSAMTDEAGEVLLADDLSLMGERMETAESTTLSETTWDDEPIWAIATPLLGENQEQIGTLHVGVRRASIDEFLAESRRLFMLIGLIAVLAGTIVAQGIGGAVTAPVQQLVSQTRRVQQGDLAVQFNTTGRDELTQLAQAYNEMVTGLREREWLRDMFGRFVSQEVAEAIRTGQVKLAGESRVVSVLFCDIRGFTTRSEQHTPAEMVALLNEYLPVVVNAAQQHEGTVNKFGGDSTLVIYGAPKQLAESAYQAVNTAVKLQQDLDILNETLRQRQIDPIQIGVGISTGSVLAGAVGPPERQEYTVIGDTVNLASRIESLNKEYPEYGILLSGQTYEALGARRNAFNLVDLGEIQIRGKMAPVHIWAVKL